MELPKNITQVGEADRGCKIYVEDYVISYMKQLNRAARDKDMAVALYGIKKVEDDISYLFLYGACKLTFLQQETRHLSQAQHQEIEKYRQKYFKEYTFLGYRLLNGEMIEGIHVCEQGICRYISGYAQFYEKNDSMLVYMLDVREEAHPEMVDQEKYGMVKKRQEERKSLYEEGYKKPSVNVSGNGMYKMRFVVMAVFVLLCLVGLSSMEGGEQKIDLQQKVGQLVANIMEQQIPDAPGETEQADTLVAENELVEAVLRENEQGVGAAETVTPVMSSQVEEMNILEHQGTGSANAENATGVSQMQDNKQQIEGTEMTQVPVQQSEQSPMVQQPEQSPMVQQPEMLQEEQMVTEKTTPASHIISKGDTLIGISVQYYGNEVKVSEICELNGISNPDDIKIGAKILLP